jgi:predicted DNA-binding protein YlxM (UPF0122 family)
LKEWDISNVGSLKSMFNGCALLDDVSHLKSWDVSNVRSMQGMFKNCASLSDISDLCEWKISDSTVMDSMFDGCEMLESYPDNFKMRILKDYAANPEAYQQVVDELDVSFFKNNDINDFDERDQFFIVESCADQSILAHVVDRSKIKSIQQVALSKISDEEILTDIAIHDHNYDISPSDDPSDAMNFSFYFYNREAAFKKIENGKLLLKIARQSQHLLKGIDHITDYVGSQEDWIDLALNSVSPDVRSYAFGHLEGEESFRRIADESQDEDLAARASEKISEE